MFNRDINPWETDSLNLYLACHCLKEDDKKEKKIQYAIKMMSFQSFIILTNNIYRELSKTEDAT